MERLKIFLSLQVHLYIHTHTRGVHSFVNGIAILPRNLVLPMSLLKNALLFSNLWRDCEYYYQTEQYVSKLKTKTNIKFLLVFFINFIFYFFYNPCVSYLSATSTTMSIKL